MAESLFGTDGIRGLTNAPPMDAETALKVGKAAGAYFRNGSHRHRVVIGKDTRLSGYLLEPALTSGFISMGMDVFLVGPMPTPAIAMATRSLRADLGVMISASHNPYHDNGIKFFDAKGEKLSDEVERKIAQMVQEDISHLLAKPEALGRAKRLDDAVGRYIQYVKETFPKHLQLSGLKIVVDCANGAAYKVAPTVLWELGAEVITLSNAPNGFNINKECGSTYPKNLRKEVVEHDADIGIALDGDADRLIVCDQEGIVIDGDQIMGAIARYWKEHDYLKGDGIVATVMSNLGLEEFLTTHGMTLHRAKVGDRYVIEQMKEHACNFGGEQSGHLIFSDYATTGDGLMAALQVLAILVETGKPASEVLRVFTPYPQTLKNVRFQDSAVLECSEVKNAVTSVEQSLGDEGRVLIRKSGTEPLIRIMIEGPEQKTIEEYADNIANSIEAQEKVRDIKSNSA